MDPVNDDVPVLLSLEAVVSVSEAPSLKGVPKGGPGETGSCPWGESWLSTITRVGAVQVVIASTVEDEAKAQDRRAIGDAENGLGDRVDGIGG